MFDQQTARRFYRKLLAFYPQTFRERLGESMEQTFNDLYRERQVEGRLSGFIFWMIAETGIGIIREYVLLLTDGATMKGILSNPVSAAIISLILILPIGFLRLILSSDIEPLIAPIESVLTVDGSQPNALGYTMICGGMLLLPVAFVLNLQPILKREGGEGKRRTHAINLIVGTAILLLIVLTWGALLVEEIYCLRGLRCD